MERHLKETRLLNFNHPSLTELVKNRGWTSLSEYERIARTYDFVQNEIAFGYKRRSSRCVVWAVQDG